jgi:hypothetical protein
VGGHAGRRRRCVAVSTAVWQPFTGIAEEPFSRRNQQPVRFVDAQQGRVSEFWTWGCNGPRKSLSCHLGQLRAHPGGVAQPRSCSRPWMHQVRRVKSATGCRAHRRDPHRCRVVPGRRRPVADHLPASSLRAGLRLQLLKRKPSARSRILTSPRHRAPARACIRTGCSAALAWRESRNDSDEFCFRPPRPLPLWGHRHVMNLDSRLFVSPSYTAGAAWAPGYCSGEARRAAG